MYLPPNDSSVDSTMILNEVVMLGTGDPRKKPTSNAYGSAHS